MKKSKKTRDDGQIRIRTTQALKANFIAKAKGEGRTLSNWVISKCLAALR